MISIEHIESSSYPLIALDMDTLSALQKELRGVEIAYPRGFLSAAAVANLSQPVIESLGVNTAGQICSQMTTADQSQPGFCVFRFGPKVCAWEEDELSTLLLGFCSLFGIPVRVFDRWPMWKPLGVSFEVGPARATGVGLNPLHIDVVNSRFPPDYVAFFCDRVDPLGGGHSLISNLLGAWKALSPNSLRVLSDPHFSEGAFYELTGVGSEYNPFPILDMSTTPPRIRFTAKMRYDLKETADREAFDEFLHLLQSQQKIFLLEAGDMVVVNQWVAAHGRLPLGEGQRAVPLERRRLIRQCFMTREIH
jgi:hypothetical protein